MALTPGLTGEFEQIVTPELTADALGNKGVQVFATPFVINLMELRAMSKRGG
jgi:predicted thioesterase